MNSKSQTYGCVFVLFLFLSHALLYMATPITNVHNTLHRKREISPPSPNYNSKRSRIDTLFHSPTRDFEDELLGAQSPILEDRNILPEPGRGYENSPSRHSSMNHDLLGEAILEQDNQEDSPSEDDFLLSGQDKPFRRSLYSELVSSSNFDDEIPSRRKSIMSSNLFDVEEDEDDEETTMEDKTTLPLSRSYVRPTVPPPIYEDEVDAFFSSHNPADEPEYVLSSALKMSILQQQHQQGPPFITDFPHFLTQEYFEQCGPQDRQIRRRNSQNGPYFEEKFHMIKNMGSGEYAEVWKVRCLNTNEEYAIKKSKVPFIGWDDRWLQIIEVDHLRRVKQSKHCVHMIDAWEEKGFLYIQLELCSNGSLDRYIQLKHENIDEQTVWKIFYEIVLGLQDIHAANIVHLDLKPSNILIDDRGCIKISDFGISIQTPADMRWVKGEGDRRYMAPDLLREDFDKPADIFSLGLILLELATGIVLPGTGESWEMLRVGDFSKQKSAMLRLTPFMREMIEWLLTTESRDRPTVQDIIRHPSFQAIQIHTGALHDYVEELSKSNRIRDTNEE
ncbi:kinase-like domain-containing protein [Gilbertella persicaria]|uniref:kinase-like domain-containing protein n=1 Tax=Gilbertella persicaria TaxID=101096 RepID=UPI0022204E07|nr:kinase-like domain-containing protein [Gilbertella persicaria]KAI8085773.1 kinase-like domain-containing protein [Gilbertella persicaria]